MPDDTCHRTAAGQEVPVAERVAGDDAVGRDERVLARTLHVAEQLRAVEHRDIPELLLGQFEDFGGLLKIELVDQVLIRREELG